MIHFFTKSASAFFNRFQSILKTQKVYIIIISFKILRKNFSSIITLIISDSVFSLSYIFNCFNKHMTVMNISDYTILIINFSNQCLYLVSESLSSSSSSIVSFMKFSSILIISSITNFNQY